MHNQMWHHKLHVVLVSFSAASSDMMIKGLRCSLTVWSVMLGNIEHSSLINVHHRHRSIMKLMFNWISRDNQKCRMCSIVQISQRTDNRYENCLTEHRHRSKVRRCDQKEEDVLWERNILTLFDDQREVQSVRWACMTYDSSRTSWLKHWEHDSIQHTRAERVSSRTRIAHQTLIAYHRLSRRMLKRWLSDLLQFTSHQWGLPDRDVKSPSAGKSHPSWRTTCSPTGKWPIWHLGLSRL